MCCSRFTVAQCTPAAAAYISEDLRVPGGIASNWEHLGVAAPHGCTLPLDERIFHSSLPISHSHPCHYAPSNYFAAQHNDAIGIHIPITIYGSGVPRHDLLLP